MQVSESSVLDFRVFGKSKLFEDSLIGQKTLKISHAIKKESDSGKCMCINFIFNPFVDILVYLLFGVGTIRINQLSQLIE